MTRTSIALIALLSSLALAIDDLPVYLDAGCDPGKTTGKLPNGYAQGPADMALPDKATGGKTIPVTCADAASGTDAIVVKLPRKLTSGEYWDYGVKFADDRKHGLKAYKEVHMWFKNNASTVAKFRLGWEAASGTSPMKNIELPAGGT